MQKKQITETLHVLNEHEWNTVVACLRYCRHRFNQHPDCEIHKARVKLSDIKKLLKDEQKSINDKIDQCFEELQF